MLDYRSRSRVCMSMYITTKACMHVYVCIHDGCVVKQGAYKMGDYDCSRVVHTIDTYTPVSNYQVFSSFLKYELASFSFNLIEDKYCCSKFICTIFNTTYLAVLIPTWSSFSFSAKEGGLSTSSKLSTGETEKADSAVSASRIGGEFIHFSSWASNLDSRR